jgi:hypothetical protein
MQRFEPKITTLWIYTHWAVNRLLQPLKIAYHNPFSEQNSSSVRLRVVEALHIRESHVASANQVISNFEKMLENIWRCLMENSYSVASPYSLSLWIGVGWRYEGDHLKRP